MFLICRYSQRKYNIFHEEHEGFAKLINALLTCPRAEVINEIIGHFDLDPNRVLDMVLDMLMINFSVDLLLIVDEFTTSYIPELLNFKLKQYEKLPLEEIPKNVGKTMAALLVRGYITLEHIEIYVFILL